MINRRVIRTVLNSDETTKQTTSIKDDPLLFEVTDADAFYVGFYGRFSSRYIAMDEVNTNDVSVSVKYWNGTTWVAVQDLIDQTSGFTSSGFLHWQNQDDWELKVLDPITDQELYWVKIEVDDDLSDDTAIEAVLDLYCDDEIVRPYYPELISDARYKPSGATNFLEQYVAAKDLVVLKLKQRRLIQDESQVIDINAVAIAAVHAFAWVLLHPIASSDSQRQMRDDAKSAFELEIQETNFSVDANKDGIVSDVERIDVREFLFRRR